MAKGKINREWMYCLGRSGMVERGGECSGVWSAVCGRGELGCGKVGMNKVERYEVRRRGVCGGVCGVVEEHERLQEVKQVRGEWV